MQPAPLRAGHALGYTVEKEQHPTVSSTTALCYVCCHSEQNGWFHVRFYFMKVEK